MNKKPNLSELQAKGPAADPAELAGETVTLAQLDAAADLAEQAGLSREAVKEALTTPAGDDLPPRLVEVQAHYPAEGRWVSMWRGQLHKAAELAFLVPGHAEPHRKAGAKVRVLVKDEDGQTDKFTLEYLDGPSFLQQLADL